MQRFVFVIAFVLSACQTIYSPRPNAAANMTFKSTEEVGTKGEKLTLPGYLTAPVGAGPFPAVVLLHACGGMNARNSIMRDWPGFLNGLGYVTLVVDSYSPRGASQCTDFPAGSERDNSQALAAKDAYGALIFLSNQPNVDKARVAVMGFSAGAHTMNRYILTNAISPPGQLRFKAAISFYGYCDRLDRYSKKDIAAMQIVGERDDLASACAELVKSTPMAVHILPGAEHAFDSGEGRGVTVGHRGNIHKFDRAARDASRELTKAFLAKHLGN